MKLSTIDLLTRNHFKTLKSQNITISPINHQLDNITLTFPDDAGPTFTQMGEYLDQLQELIIADNYGDLTEMKIDFTTFHGDDLDIAYTLTFNIDS